MSVTLVIIVVTIIVSLLAFNDRNIFRRLAFNAYDIFHFKNHYRFFTYAFLHADWMHLFINMMVLYSFGTNTESYFAYYFGSKATFYYVLLYFGAIVLSTLPAYGKHKNDYAYTAVGASGAVSGVLFANILFDPLAKIYFFMIPIGIPAIIFGVLYLVYSWYMSKRNVDNIGHDVHFWGAIFGFLFPLALKPQLFEIFLHNASALLRG